MLPPSTVLQQRYRLERCVARGGMGAVYLATDLRLGHPVAVKQSLLADPALRDAFQREARLLARLRHPTLPKVSDHFVEGIEQFLVMDYIPGDDLAALLRRRGAPFPVAEVLGWADHLLAALAYLHAREPRVIHRDIKPSNLKLTAQGDIVLLDFGLAKGDPEMGSASGSLAGYTLHYAPLEQIRGQGTEPRSDLFSLAATLYDLLTAVKPPDAVQRAAALAAGMADPLRPAHAVNPSVPAGVSLVLERALALATDQRLASAEEMRHALRVAAGADGTMLARPAMPAAPARDERPDAPDAANPPASMPVGERLATNPPARGARLIGREEEVAALRGLLRAPGTRLVTLTGLGGLGKTSLALRAAAEVRDDFADGVVVVSLAPLRDPGVVPSAIAKALDLNEGDGRPLLDALRARLRSLELLLVLDNFEQVIAAADVVADLLAAAPRLTILVTSRAVLRLHEEIERPVAPLALPDPSRPAGVPDLEAVAAVALFVERARAVRPAFRLTEENAATVAEICRRLEGLPLAIELAAARARLLAPEALLARLGSRLTLLTGGARDLPARQQTLRAALTWSYDLLTPDEQALFRRLAVFSGGCTVEAAEIVCPAAGPLELEILDGLTALIEHSLLRQEERGDDAPRLMMLETVREYGLACLTASGEAAATRQAHAAYCRELAEAAEAELTGPAQVAWLERLEREHDNLRAALDWALTAGEPALGPRLGGALWRFWEMRGYLSEGRRWLEAALARGADAPAAVRAKALNGAGNLARGQSDLGRAAALHEAALAVRRELGDQLGIAASLNNLGNVAIDQGAFTRARQYHQEALQLRRAAGDRFSIALSLNNLGLVEQHQGDHGRAAALYQESLALFRALGDRWGETLALDNLGELAQRTGDCARARGFSEQALALRQQSNDKWGICITLVNLGRVAREQADHGRAGALLDEALRVYREMGDRRGIANALAALGEVARDLGDHQRARELLDAALGVHREVGDAVGVASALSGLGTVALDRGESGRARALHDEALALRREQGDKEGIVSSLVSLAHLAGEQGDDARAAQLYAEGVRLLRGLGSRLSIARCLDGVGALALARRQPERAARLLAAAEALREAAGAGTPPADLPTRERRRAAIQAALGDGGEAAWMAGRSLSAEAALAEAQAVVRPPAGAG